MQLSLVRGLTVVPDCAIGLPVVSIVRVSLFEVISALSQGYAFSKRGVSRRVYASPARALAPRSTDKNSCTCGATSSKTTWGAEASFKLCSRSPARKLGLVYSHHLRSSHKQVGWWYEERPQLSTSPALCLARRAQSLSTFAWHHSPDATCLIRPRLFYAMFIASRITVNLWKDSSVRLVVLDKWLLLN